MASNLRRLPTIDTSDADPFDGLVRSIVLAEVRRRGVRPDKIAALVRCAIRLAGEVEAQLQEMRR